VSNVILPLYSRSKSLLPLLMMMLLMLMPLRVPLLLLMLMPLRVLLLLLPIRQQEEEELEDVLASAHFVAGFTDEAVEAREDLYDVCLNGVCVCVYV